MAIQTKQTTQQRLILAPNITLALEILRMPTLELQAFLEHQLEENPILEVNEVSANEAADDSTSAESDGKGEEPSELSSALDEDWLSHWRTASEHEESNSEAERENRVVEQRLSTVQSLYESLRVQLGCQRLSEGERRLGDLLINHLDQSGYLEDSLEELAASAGVTCEQLEQVLKVIQQFDPSGVGARDLRECLMIQLRQDGAHDSLAYRILEDHFPLFVQHRLSALVRATGAEEQDVRAAFERIKQLNPKPGRVFVGELPPSLIPDLVIYQREKHFDVELNDQHVPHVSVSRFYYRMLKDPRTPNDAKEFLVGKLRQASWLIKAIEERNTTLLSIGRCLISLQRDFLAQGAQALKPLTQAQVASLIGRHPSTVSRAITGKTIDTPYGVFYLEQLFASGVQQETTTEAISDEHIKSELRRLIDEEDAEKPLSDAVLARRLAERHVVVARRTITKYRASLKILPAHLRKRRL